jgi:hypothetical protein
MQDMTSLNPFSHVYTFQIGMPEDVVEHMLQLIVVRDNLSLLMLAPAKLRHQHVLF